MWILKTTSEGRAEQTFRILTGGVRTIGRAVGADFIIDAGLISRIHCRLTALPGGELEVRDLDSTNGTFVNGHRIGTAHLGSGDTLRIGRVELVAMNHADPTDEKAERSEPRAEENPAEPQGPRLEP
jgi:pSer/pThr/pTyr-binding forkhead associated (FHA) protein